MDVYAELSARQQRPQHPTMAVPPLQPHQVSPKMKFPLAPQTTVPPLPPPSSNHVPRTSSDSVAVPTASSRSSQETLSPSSPQRIHTNASTGSSPTKTASSSSSSYELPTTLSQVHPSNKPTAPLYRPAALRSADHPAPPQPFPRKNSFSFKDSPPVKRDHWKVHSETQQTCPN